MAKLTYYLDSVVILIYTVRRFAGRVSLKRSCYTLYTKVDIPFTFNISGCIGPLCEMLLIIVIRFLDL